MGDHRVIHGAVAVIQRDRRLLVIRRAEGILAAGWWCFPGGAIEPGERAEDAVRREAMEELALTVEPLRQVWTWQRPDGGLILHWWEVQLEPADQLPTPNPAEVAEFRWLLPGEIPRLNPLLASNLAFMQVWHAREW